MSSSKYYLNWKFHLFEAFSLSKINLPAYLSAVPRWTLQNKYAFQRGHLTQFFT